MPVLSMRTLGAAALLAGGGFWLCAASGQAAALDAIRTNGTPANRVNIVLLSEGYTSDQLGQFLVDATNAIDALSAYQPYQEYRSCLNAFAISVPSNQSGSTHSYLSKDTYFHSSYDANDDVVITIPPNPSDPNSGDGQGRVDALLQSFGMTNAVPILLVNDRVPGGSGGKTAIFSVGSDPSRLAHECGHTLGALGDEYAYGFHDLTIPAVELANTTAETNRARIRWSAWIDPGTPVPTPPNAYPSVIGLFEGANYQPTGWYRPKVNCLMGSYGPGIPFCEVCREALVLAFYRKIRPADVFTPMSTNLSAASAQPLTFSVGVVQPATHNLGVQWLTNGTPVAGATNATFTLWPGPPGNGPQNVRAEIQDGTSFVRSDPTNLLHQTVSWNLLWLDSIRWLPGGSFAFRLTGAAPQGFVIQSSTNLMNWIALATNSLTAGQFNYTNFGPANLPRRYFWVQARP